MPTNMSAMATNAKTEAWPECNCCAMTGTLVEPVAPNMRAIPYKKKAAANEPRRKYFSDDSLLIATRRRKPASMQVEMEKISTAMRISTSSVAEDISIMPTAPQ